MPGHHDAGNEYTSLDDAKKATTDAINMGLAGIIKHDCICICFFNLKEVESYLYVFNLRSDDMGHQ